MCIRDSGKACGGHVLLGACIQKAEFGNVDGTRQNAGRDVYKRQSTKSAIRWNVPAAIGNLANGLRKLQSGNYGKKPAQMFFIWKQLALME